MIENAYVKGSASEMITAGTFVIARSSLIPHFQMHIGLYFLRVELLLCKLGYGSLSAKLISIHAPGDSVQLQDDELQRSTRSPGEFTMSTFHDTELILR